MPRIYPGPTGALRRRPVLALLPGEPAGRISTANAGAVSFAVKLSLRPGEKMPDGPSIGGLSIPGARLCSLYSSDGPSWTRRLSCEIHAFRTGRLADALDVVLRSVTEHAALAEAVLETRAVRLAEPTTPPSALVEMLARHLWQAGFHVSFGPSWTPAPAGADITIGASDLEAALEGFLCDHPAWRPLPR